MSYLATNTQVFSLTIGGTDYTSSLVSWEVSDSAAIIDGLVSTNGTLILAGIPGGASIQDYDRNLFKRGTEVILTLTARDINGNSVVIRHPRGLLYVLGNGYSVENANVNIQIGCKIALATLIDDPTDLLPFAAVPLDPTQQTIQGVAGSLQTVGKYLYQNNQGTLISDYFFNGDTDTGYNQPQGEWISILGVTALSVAPLQGSGAIPDVIQYAYTRPTSLGDGPSRVDIVTTESNYFITYPAVSYVRTVSNGRGLSGISGVDPGTTLSQALESSCGNTPPMPQQGLQQPSCNEGYELNQTPIILPAYKHETSISEYDGPAGQSSRNYVETYGPAIEANSQYYADEYAYCRHTWSTACQPNGACSTANGMEEIKLGYTETIYFYGDANELVKTVTDTYATTLSAAQPFDWRAGVVNGVPQSFTTLANDTFFRISRVVTEYSTKDGANIQDTTTYSSVTSRGVGIKQGDIDALTGIITSQRRTSVTISALPLAPDSINTPQTPTFEVRSTIPVLLKQYTNLPVTSGPYSIQEQSPVALLYDTEEEIEEAAAIATAFAKRRLLGQAFGMQIGEALRADIATTWRPGMNFRYWSDAPGPDNKDELDRLMAMRMDSCVWGARPDGVEVVMNAIWVGDSNGYVTTGSNVLGTNEDVSDHVVVDETIVTTGSYAFVVNIEIPVQHTFTPFVDQIVFYPPEDRYDVLNYTTTTFWVDGIVVGPGSLAALGPNGSPPLSNDGNLLLDVATVIEPDLFAGYTSNNAESPEDFS